MNTTNLLMLPSAKKRSVSSMLNRTSPKNRLSLLNLYVSKLVSARLYQPLPASLNDDLQGTQAAALTGGRIKDGTLQQMAGRSNHTDMLMVQGDQSAAKQLMLSLTLLAVPLLAGVAAHNLLLAHFACCEKCQPALPPAAVAAVAAGVIV